MREKSPAVLQFDGKSESVRDVSFHPRDGNLFASSYESGCVKIWDMRNSTVSERNISAHNGIALCLDWRRDGRYLATGGRDKLVKVWDMNSDCRRSFQTIQMIASVGRVKWRPGGSSNQLAACSLLSDYRVHVWNIDRPFLPERCFENHKNVTSGICWKNANCLLSVSKDKFFIEQFYDSSGYSPINHISKSDSSWNIDGKLISFVKGPRDQICQEIKLSDSLSLLGKLASEYSIRKAGESIVEAITHNIKVCEKLKEQDLSDIWFILLESVQYDGRQ